MLSSMSVKNEEGKQKSPLSWAGVEPFYAGKRNGTILFVTCDICLFLLCHKELRPDDVTEDDLLL